MKLIISSVLICLAVLSSVGQDQDPEYWRKMGYQAKLAGDYPSAIENYGKILQHDSTDYDARLALARLYTIVEDYEKAASLYNEIYTNDSTDVEALNGLGNISLVTGKTGESIQYFEKALHFLPGEVQQYFYLAKAYSYAGRLNDAIEVYKEINNIDNTYAEAWAGIGKMYYWKGKPKTAAGYYKKAIELDPGNEETMEEYRKINNELKFVISLKSGPVQEIEENYEINAIISRIKVEKRINDWFHLEANYLLDYSDRVFTDNIGDTTRWYSTPWIKAGWLSEHHRISGWIGYTTTDNKFSSYGLNWKLNYNFGKFKLSNALTAGYDYFYYWNEVGAKSISDNLELGYRKFDLSASYAYGVVDAVLVADEYSGTYGEKTNPYTSYGLSLAYRILSRPVIKVGLNYSFLDYTYKSPLYYTPFERNLYGGMASLYYDYKSFYFYGSFSYNLGTEINYEQFGNSNRFRKEKVDVDNWSANVELGYQHDPFSISIGGSNFYNPFYRNITGFLAIKFLF